MWDNSIARSDMSHPNKSTGLKQAEVLLFRAPHDVGRSAGILPKCLRGGRTNRYGRSGGSEKGVFWTSLEALISSSSGLTAVIR